jgi:hypothetical protein
MYEWQIQNDDTLQDFRFNEQIGVLQCNGSSEALTAPASAVLGVLLAHADAPVTPEDFFEAQVETRGGTAKKAIRELKSHELIGHHILQVGTNKRAVYSFLTNPVDADLLLDRMNHVHDILYKMTPDTDTAKKHADTIIKVGKVATAIAAAATTAYVVVKHVRKRR